MINVEHEEADNQSDQTKPDPSAYILTFQDGSQKMAQGYLGMFGDIIAVGDGKGDLSLVASFGADLKLVEQIQKAANHLAS